MMRLPVIVIILGFLPVWVILFAICFELYKNYKTKIAFSVLASAPGTFSPRKVSKSLVILVRIGNILKHILINSSPPFNDAECLRGYKTHIRNPLIKDHINNLKGGFNYE